MEHVLVTGGAGYIGSHTCKALSQAGYIPIAFDNLVHGHEWAVRWGPFEQGDILDKGRISQVLQQYSPSAVIHFAAFAYVGESVSNPGKYYRNNVVGTLNLLEVMEEVQVSRLVFSSSCATYGIPDSVPISEEAPQRPINPYGLSKLMCEQIISDFCAASSLSSIGLRYFNAAGADADGELGEEHDPETHIIPLVLAAAAGKRNDVTIFGSDYNTLDGTCVRDYIHVTDLATAHVAALKALRAYKGWHAFNIGTGSGVSVAELIAAAEHVTNAAVQTKVGERRKGDPAVLIANPSSAGSHLSWRATNSSLENILQTAWAWMTRSKEVPD